MKEVETSAGLLIYERDKFVMYAPCVPHGVAVKDFAYRLENNILMNRVVGYAKTEYDSKECADRQ